MLSLLFFKGTALIEAKKIIRPPILFSSSRKATLKQIKAPIASELIQFDAFFKESMRSQVALLDKVMHYIVKRKGKQVRPILVFLSAKLWGETTETTYRAATFVELLHTATLVHDDVVDDSDKRRGWLSINAIWKNKIAVLVGDYLLSKGLLLALDNKEYQLLHIISEAVKSLSEGELLQIEKARKLDIEEDIYFDIIKKKTASLMASSCAAGASSVTEDETIVEKMRQFGETLGIAFQIKDDLFDYGNGPIGKPTGIDIKEKKMTLPLIHALSKASKSEKRDIIYSIKKRSTQKKTIRNVISFVKTNGGLEYAADIMKDYRQQALDMLGSFPESDARTAMTQLVDFVIEREK